jgi:hypothetical protein
MGAVCDRRAGVAQREAHASTGASAPINAAISRDGTTA